MAEYKILLVHFNDHNNLKLIGEKFSQTPQT